MVRALKRRVTVQPSGLVEVRAEELTPGSGAEVIILVDQPSPEPRGLASFIGTAKGTFSSIEEADAFVR